MDVRRRKVLVVVATATLLCGGVVVEMSGAGDSSSGGNAMNAAAQERADEDTAPKDAALPSRSWEDTFIVDNDQDDGTRTPDHPAAVVAPPGAGPGSSTSCSEVRADGSQRCITITLDSYRTAGDDTATTEPIVRVRVETPALDR